MARGPDAELQAQVQDLQSCVKPDKLFRIPFLVIREKVCGASGQKLWHPAGEEAEHRNPGLMM